MRGFISYLDTNIAVVPLVNGSIPYLYCTRSKFVMPGLNEDEVLDNILVTRRRIVTTKRL